MVSFERVPRFHFLYRRSPRLISAFGLAVLLVGLLGAIPGGGPWADRVLWERAPVTAVPLGAWTLYTGVVERIGNYPSVCRSLEGLEPFQRTQCERFRARLIRGILLGLFPFITLIGYSRILLGRLGRFYESAEAVIQKRQRTGLATVTQPAEAPHNSFSRFYCLRPISVQFKGGGQETVYLPEDAPVPMPGQELALFSVGEHQGKIRSIAMLHAPHLAILRGSR